MIIVPGMRRDNLPVRIYMKQNQFNRRTACGVRFRGKHFSECCSAIYAVQMDIKKRKKEKHKMSDT